MEIDFHAPMTGSKLRLYETAERLFAEQGFHQISVRDIATAAKANVAAVHYYFGSRDRLIFQIFISHIEKLVELWNEELKNHPPRSAADVLHCYISIVQRLIYESSMEDHLAANLLARILHHQEIAWPEAVSKAYGEITQSIASHFAGFFTEMTISDFLSRFRMVHASLVFHLANFKASSFLEEIKTLKELSYILLPSSEASRHATGVISVEADEGQGTFAF